MGLRCTFPSLFLQIHQAMNLRRTQRRTPLTQGLGRKSLSMEKRRQSVAVIVSFDFTGSHHVPGTLLGTSSGIRLMRDRPSTDTSSTQAHLPPGHPHTSLGTAMPSASHNTLTHALPSKLLLFLEGPASVFSEPSLGPLPGPIMPSLKVLPVLCSSAIICFNLPH